MADWRAVAVGLVVIAVVDTGGLALPVAGQIGVGLLGGFTAGYPAGDMLSNDTWSGPVAGSTSDIAITLFATLLGSLLGLTGGPLDGLLGDVGVLAADVVLTLIFTIDSAIAGAADA